MAGGAILPVPAEGTVVASLAYGFAVAVADASVEWDFPQVPAAVADWLVAVLAGISEVDCLIVAS